MSILTTGLAIIGTIVVSGVCNIAWIMFVLYYMDHLLRTILVHISDDLMDATSIFVAMGAYVLLFWPFVVLVTIGILNIL